jgi:hypothetical protein
MLCWHLLYLTELSSFVHPTGFEPATSGFLRRSTRLSYECHVLRSAEHETRIAHRAGRDQQPEPKAKRRSALMTQVDFARKRKPRLEVALIRDLCPAGHNGSAGAPLR